MAKKNLNWRALTSLILVWSFIIEVITGIVLYIVPPGRIANWTNWKLLGINKSGWEALHTIFGYLFLFFGILHIIYNWKPMVNYIKKKVNTGIRVKKELVISAIITVIFTAGTLFNAVPFKSVMDFGDKLKNSWSTNEEEPVIPHLELQSFSEFTKIVGTDIKQAIDILKEKGIIIENSAEKLQDIAEKYNTSPQKIYEYVVEKSNLQNKTSLPVNTNSEGEVQGTGLGRKTVEIFCKEQNIPLDRAINILESHGINTKKDDTLRDLANKADKTPAEIAELITSTK